MDYSIFQRGDMKFVWDEKKDQANIKKHKISFTRALLAFSDPLKKEYFDYKHSGSEEERLMLAGAAENRILLVSFIEPAPETIRIISARKATNHEVEVYYYGNG
jgi:uncharacterized DUF497 family protein